MGKRKQIEILGKIIGLNAAHKILIEFTNKPESIRKMQSEVDHYDELNMQLTEGNWNSSDIEKIKQIAEKRCVKKLEQYEDIENKKYSMVDKAIQEIMKDWELER